jgi:hypothetical protein
MQDKEHRDEHQAEHHRERQSDAEEASDEVLNRRPRGEQQRHDAERQQ